MKHMKTVMMSVLTLNSAWAGAPLENISPAACREKIAITLRADSAPAEIFKALSYLTDKGRVDWDGSGTSRIPALKLKTLQMKTQPETGDLLVSAKVSFNFSNLFLSHWIQDLAEVGAVRGIRCGRK